MNHKFKLCVCILLGGIFFLSHSVNRSTLESYYNALFLNALDDDQVEEIDILLSYNIQGLDIDTCKVNGKSTAPILYAIKSGSDNAAHYFLDHGARIDNTIKTAAGMPLLNLAVQEQCFSVAQRLLDYDLNVNQKNVWGKDIVSLTALNFRSLDFFKKLFARGAKVQTSGLMKILLEKESLSSLSFVYEQCKLQNKPQKLDPAIRAILENDIVYIREMLNGNAAGKTNKQDFNWYARIAAFNNKAEIFKIFLAKGYGFSRNEPQNRSILRSASAFGFYDIVTALVEAGDDINFRNNENTNCAIVLAIKHNHKDIVKYLLEHGANDFMIREIDEPKATDIVNFALVYADVEMGQILLDTEQVHAFPPFITPRMAYCRDAIQKMDFLMKHGYDVNTSAKLDEILFLSALRVRADFETFEWIVNHTRNEIINNEKNTTKAIIIASTQSNEGKRLRILLPYWEELNSQMLMFPLDSNNYKIVDLLFDKCRLSMEEKEEYFVRYAGFCISKNT